MKRCPLTFSAGMLEPNYEISLSWGAGNMAAQSFTQTNDYSFSTSQMLSSEYSRVTLHYNGCLIWGVEP